MKKLFLILFFIQMTSFLIHGQPCIQGVVNAYTPVVAFKCTGNAVEVSDPGLFQKGDLVLIIQMQGASIISDNSMSFGDIDSLSKAGNYEFNRIHEVQLNNILLEYKLTKSYNLAGKIQLIKVPEYQNIEICDLTCLDWNGTIGGVLAIKNTGYLKMSGDINVSEKGFRGGILNNCNQTSNHETNYVYFPDPNVSAAKGESVASIDFNISYGRGKAINGGGGGNAHNAGGGGGGGWGNGGNGGQEFSHTIPNPNTFGVGGLGLSNQPNRIFMGGGGGSGHTNDFTGTSGGNGGGIAIIITDKIIANGHQIISNGEDVLGGSYNNDGQGGGGTIALYAPEIEGSLNIKAKGGTGGNSIFLNAPYQKIGPGGGGGGGSIYRYHNTPDILTDLAGGSHGWANQSDPYGASNGVAGGGISGISIPIDTILINRHYQIIPTNPDCDYSDNGSIEIISNNASSYIINNILSNSGIYTNLDTGKYYVTINFNDGCSTIDTTELIGGLHKTIEQTYLLCPGDFIEINGVSHFAPELIIDTLQSLGTCDTIRLISILPSPLPTTSRTFSFCPGDTLSIAGQLFSQPLTIIDTVPAITGCDTVRTTIFKWSDLPQVVREVYVCPGDSIYIGGKWYWEGATVKDTIFYPEQCDTVNIIHILNYTTSFTPFLPENAVLCPGNPLVFNSPYFSTLWNNETSSPIYTAQQVGWLTAEVADEHGCRYRDTVEIRYCCNESTIYAPNSFTPESDPPNDLFRVFTKGTCDTHLLRIYDRWGALLFESQNPSDGWDGTFRGKKCESGVYVWTLETNQSGQPKKVVLKGDVTLIR